MGLFGSILSGLVETVAGVAIDGVSELFESSDTDALDSRPKGGGGGADNYVPNTSESNYPSESNNSGYSSIQDNNNTSSTSDSSTNSESS